jgi:hypothetical protein
MAGVNAEKNLLKIERLTKIAADRQRPIRRFGAC